MDAHRSTGWVMVVRCTHLYLYITLTDSLVSIIQLQISGWEHEGEELQMIWENITDVFRHLKMIYLYRLSFVPHFWPQSLLTRPTIRSSSKAMPLLSATLCTSPMELYTLLL